MTRPLISALLASCLGLLVSIEPRIGGIGFVQIGPRSHGSPPVARCCALPKSRR